MVFLTPQLIILTIRLNIKNWLNGTKRSFRCIKFESWPLRSLKWKFYFRKDSNPLCLLSSENDSLGTNLTLAFWFCCIPFYVYFVFSAAVSFLRSKVLRKCQKRFFFFFLLLFFFVSLFFLIQHIEQLQHCTQPRIITEQWGATKVVFTQENEVARMQTRTRSWQLNNYYSGVSRIKIQYSTDIMNCEYQQVY